MTYSVDAIKEKVVEISKKNPIERVYLFGSYAKGTVTADSDVDLRIDLSAPIGLFKFCGILNSYQDALGCKVDLLITRSIKEPFLCEIQKEEILLYEREQ